MKGGRVTSFAVLPRAQRRLCGTPRAFLSGGGVEFALVADPSPLGVPALPQPRHVFSLLQSQCWSAAVTQLCECAHFFAQRF